MRRGRSAADLQSAGFPLVVVNFGTATRIYRDRERWPLLGARLPRAFESRSTPWPRDRETAAIALAAPPSAIRGDTVVALQSGIMYGAVAQTEGIVARLQAEIGGNVGVIATGGLADVVARETRTIERVHPNLVHED